jgi:hypothetical protein
VTDFSVSPFELRVLGTYLTTASEDIQHLGHNFAAAISGPKSESVLGSAEAAAKYADAANECVENISRLVLSMGGFAQRMLTAAAVYAQTEEEHTVTVEDLL